MTFEDARGLMIAGNKVMFDGVIYSHVKYVQVEYNRKTHRDNVRLALNARCANSITIVDGDWCTVLPLD